MQNLGQKVIYQIYPKSFYDANGDGIGDLRGIIEKIDYIKKLNVDMIWFNPFYVSLQNDNGYDIANYREIDPLFGTMADFEELQAKLADIGVGVMLDMVLNHCSTEHEWFKKALAGDEKYRKFFYLRPGKPDGSLPNNWQSKFGGPAWSKFGDTDLYYLHLYDSTQADLDWHNPEVRKELEDVVNFWRGKGVRGFRFDVINVTGKSEDLVDSTDPTEEKTLYTDTPVVHDYLKELNRTTFGQDEDSITVGEMSSTTIPNSVRYTNPKEKELSMVFTFHHLKVDYKDGEKWTKTPFDFMKLKGLLSSWQTGMTEGGGWNAVFWNNHDQPWALNRFGDPVHYREKSAEMLAATIHFLRGTPFIYQGEELGMVNPDYQSMDEYVDVECKNAYQELLDKGMSEDEAFAIIKAKSRDNSRVPMHWDDSKYAGFSQVKPWLLPTHQDEINVKKELAEGEVFAFYQKLIALRKQEAVISAGGFREILPDDQQVFAYVRELDGEKLVVFNNFYGKEAVISVPSDLQECGQILLDNYQRELSCLPSDLQECGQILLDNYQRELSCLPSELSLRPYESLAFRI
ncbi:alpha,alpha-phosphotrehalase [Lactobacillus delbrueckii subsp. allosunkii]|uniref:alpha,alpha-phosphotrehalase n=1 Tax=Lactobacillus delbrueckii TaxID=1584 RepID=UPI0022A77B57|nr:alpha,alpha-phosphotrehalase [Lactobacillus delbrueckii]MCZ0788648.1 alpha,alpha-phosphotrehalase [Lactobacillus delbrueckii subsp. sunkii]